MAHLRHAHFLLTIAMLMLGLSASAQSMPQSMPQSTAGLDIVIVSAEMKGAFQTGGLGHATADLALSATQAGYRVQVLLPKYLRMTETGATELGREISAPIDWYEGVSYKKAQFSLLEGSVHGVDTVLFRHDAPPGQTNYFDNLADGKYPSDQGHLAGENFGALARAQADYILAQKPKIVVLNDWTSGLVALFLREAEARGEKIPKIIFAIHNIRYQGLYAAELSKWLGVSWDHWHIDGVAHEGRWSMLKAGLMYSDMVYTVSPTYAKEIQEPLYGMSLEGVMQLKSRQNRLTGVLNGIINEEWDPSLKKPNLSFEFDAGALGGKAKGKAALQKEMGLPVRAASPLFVLTSRLDEQKGFAYLMPAIERIVATQDVQFLVIGDGDERYIAQLQDLQRRYPTKLKYQSFDGTLEKKLMRYGDFFVNGAWFEPCGLNQFFALRNGTIPLVSDVGGLKDSIHDGVNGLKFEVVRDSQAPYSVAPSRDAAVAMFLRAIALSSKPKALRAMRVRGMSENHSWAKRLDLYFNALFEYVLKEGYNKGPLIFEKANLELAKELAQAKADRRAAINDSAVGRAVRVPKTISSRNAKAAVGGTCSMLFGR